MTNSTYTRKEVFKILLNLVEKSEKTLKDMGEHYEAIYQAITTEIDRLNAQAEKRKNTPRKPTQKQKQNEELKALLLHDFFSKKRAFCVHDIMKTVNFSGELFGVVTPRRISALCTSLVGNGVLNSVMQHNKTYYCLSGLNILEEIYKRNEEELVKKIVQHVSKG